MTTTTPAAFAALRDDLSPYLINRSDELEMATLALVAKCHMFLLSEPGTAKSMLVKEIVKRIGGANAFLVMLNKFADDSLLLGPSSLAGLKEGRRRRETAGYLPECEIFFADEIWKGSSALVNTLLQITNERVFFDDGREQPVRLWTMFCASNELPQQEHEELAAIFDRTGLRRIVPKLTDPGDLKRLLTLPEPPENPPTLLDWSNVAEAHEQAMALKVADEALEALIDIVTRCHGQGVPVPSGRRMREAERIAKANAWLQGASKVGPEHFDFLVDYLWEDPKQRPQICRVVYDVSAPLRADALTLSDDVAGLIVTLNETVKLDDGAPEKAQATLDLTKKVKRAAHTAFELEQKVDGRAAADVAAAFDRIEDLYDAVQVKLFGLSAGRTNSAKEEARRGEWASV